MADGTIPRPAAALAIGATVVAAGVIANRWGPTPQHPATKDWYDNRLDKPRWTPPPPVFAIAWPLIEAGLATGAWRLMRLPRSRARDAALLLQLAEQAGLAGWNLVFFGRRRLLAGTFAAGGLAVGAAASAILHAREDRVAGVAVSPLVAWLSFATLLSGAVWSRNRDG